MAAGKVIYEEWLNNNQNRNYPFYDDVSLMDDSGTLRVPNDFIVDLSFAVHAFDYDLNKFHLHTLKIFSDTIIITLGYDGIEIAERSILIKNHTENKTYFIEGLGSFSDSVGRIAIGRLDSLLKFGGVYTFTSNNGFNARLLPTVLRPTTKAVTGIRVVSADNEASEIIQGDIEFIAGENIEFTKIGNQLIISAVNNPNYDKSCNCPDAPIGDCIKKINGIPPDTSGNFTIEGSHCVQILGGTAAITIDDTCAEPCCGCQELDVLRTELAKLSSQIATQKAFAQRAFASIEQLRTAILSSKIGDLISC